MRSVASLQLRSWTGALSLLAVGLAIAALILASLAFTHHEVPTTATTPTTTIPSRVAVPDVVGLTQSATVARLQAAGLAVTIGMGQPSNSVPSGDVISESPLPGSMVVRGSTIMVALSVGPNP